MSVRINDIKSAEEGLNEQNDNVQIANVKKSYKLVSGTKYLVHGIAVKKVMSSTWREAEAVKRVMKSNMNDIKGKKVKVYSDNKNVQSILKIGSKK